MVKQAWDNSLEFLFFIIKTKEAGGQFKNKFQIYISRPKGNNYFIEFANSIIFFLFIEIKLYYVGVLQVMVLK